MVLTRLLRFLRPVPEDDGERYLLAWFGASQVDGRVSMETFDKEYRELFGRRPLWYTWRSFYRDHGFVGLRSNGR